MGVARLTVESPSAIENKATKVVVNPSSAIVLGAGISGLVAASVLAKDGFQNILVVDEYDHVGGNHIDRTIGSYTFDIGSLIFQDDSPLLAHFPELLPHYVAIKPTWGRLNPQGVVTAYPISVKHDVFDAGPIAWARFAGSVAFARLFRRKLNSAHDFARYWVGAHLLHRSGLGHYMARFYGMPPKDIDLEFAEKRMLWIKEQATLRNVLQRLLKPSGVAVTNSQLARPREGFAHLYQAAIQSLAKRGVSFRLGEKLVGVQKVNGSFSVTLGSGTLEADRVVSTIPLERAQELCSIASAKRLKTVTLISLFYSFSGNRGFNDSVLYNFSHLGLWKRLTMYSEFYGKADGREYFTVEVTADDNGPSIEQAAADFRRHTIANGLFAGDLKLESTHVLANAYPVYTDNASETAAQGMAALKNFGILSLGRQGGFEYQPTARDSTLKAEAALARGM